MNIELLIDALMRFSDKRKNAEKAQFPGAKKINKKYLKT